MGSSSDDQTSACPAGLGLLLQSHTCQPAGEEAGLGTATRVQGKGRAGNALVNTNYICQLCQAKAGFLQSGTTAGVLAVFHDQKE